MLRPARVLLPVALAVALGGLGCDDDGGGGPSAVRSSFQGIWSITAWSRNPDGCDAPGESILESERDRFMLVQGCTFSFPGLSSGSYLQAVGCESAEACEEERCGDNEISFGGWSFEGGDDDAGWRGDASSAYASGGAETCEGEARTFVLRREGDGLVLEERATRVTGLARDAEGHCDTDAARQAASGQPCSELERLELRLATEE